MRDRIGLLVGDRRVKGALGQHLSLVLFSALAVTRRKVCLLFSFENIFLKKHAMVDVEGGKLPNKENDVTCKLLLHSTTDMLKILIIMSSIFLCKIQHISIFNSLGNIHP
ncbi:hypothetical protein IHE45_16G019800 [Dioscorea alata]|uniref:Uncharacterized protein n=1 Tax=Dioscorea alata TaxID=55571 RepID=A0ACB7UG45_DIOAL|nr:hypothetical protein IHE45_16G019800 [Dioscorea alata]